MLTKRILFVACLVAALVSAAIGIIYVSEGAIRAGTMHIADVVFGLGAAAGAIVFCILARVVQAEVQQAELKQWMNQLYNASIRPR